MSERANALLSMVAPSLAPSERVWAIYDGPQQLVATDHRLFFITEGSIHARGLDEFVSVRREAENVAVLRDRAGAVLAFELPRDDDERLQELAVVGLLVGSQAGARRW